MTRKEWWYSESGKGDDDPRHCRQISGPTPDVLLPDGTLLRCESTMAAQTVTHVLRLLVHQQVSPSERPPATNPEEAALEFFESLLRVTYPGRAVAVTPAPLPEGMVPAEGFDGSGIVDVTIGPLPDEPMWVSFRCNVLETVTQKDWPAAAHVLRTAVAEQFELWRVQ